MTGIHKNKNIFLYETKNKSKKGESWYFVGKL
nr:MAG TPA: hypothetical protein [Caudoviricetes sp.]